MDEIRGEMVIVVEGKQESEQDRPQQEDILSMVNARIQEGMSTKYAIRSVAQAAGLSKNEVYDLVVSQKQ